MTSRTTTPKPLAAASSPRVAAYLAGAVGTAALLSAPQAEAAVTAVTFGFGNTLDVGESGVFSVGSFGTLYASNIAQYQVAIGDTSFSAGGGVYHSSNYIRFFLTGVPSGAGPGIWAKRICID